MGQPVAAVGRAICAELLADGVDIVVVRILGGYRAWQNGIDAVIASGCRRSSVSGEQAPTPT